MASGADISGSRASRRANSSVVSTKGFDPGRIADLQLALDLALAWLCHYEPGDSRAVSNEFVAMAAIACDLADEECRQIIRDALAIEDSRHD